MLGAARRCASALATSSKSLQNAYVEALKVIEAHSAKTTDSVRVLQQMATDIKAASPDEEPALKKAQELERISNDLLYRVGSNDADNIANLRHGRADLNDLVQRTMALKHYKRVRMPKLLLRAEQHHIFADLFPKPVDGSLDVEVHAAVEKDGELQLVSNASEIPPSQTLSPPLVHVQPYHKDMRNYTVIMIDCDMPHDEEGLYKDHILWLHTDIPLSATHALSPLPLAVALPSYDEDIVRSAKAGKLILPYLPPHPARGTSYHRIALLVCEQTDVTKSKLIVEDLPRDTPVHRLLLECGLRPRGLCFWKSSWDETVSMVYRDIFKVIEPKFVYPRRVGLKGVDDLRTNQYETY